MPYKDNEYSKKDHNTPVLHMNWEVLKDIINTIGALPAESGGAIGGYNDGNKMTHYHFDENSRNSSVTYSPDYKTLNRLFKYDWNPNGIRFQGFVHSHPGRMNRPSFGDEIYAERILKAIDDLDSLWLPIINTTPDTGVFRLTPWIAYPKAKGVSVVKGKVKILQGSHELALSSCDNNAYKSLQMDVPLEEIIIGDNKTSRSNTKLTTVNNVVSKNISYKASLNETRKEGYNYIKESARSFNVQNTFDRVQSVYDLELMQKIRLIAVGAGGAADWLEAMARSGVGQFVMIDPDIVSETNLATQQTYRKDIGRPKVDCIAERIRDINPTTRTIAIQKSLDEITDEEMKEFADKPIDGCEVEKTIICGLTDNFYAQARVNRLALHLGIPSLCAQVYKEGRGAEITFTHPGVTPACHRCILSSRYKYFMEQNRENDVTSHGTPIFATTRLNAIKGFLTLALIHHGTDHPRWGSMLSRIGNRNLIQIRMDPDFSETLGMKTFNRVLNGADKERLFFDEVVWLPQEQECPETGYAYCPDCGGTGDLHDAIGKFNDTRLSSNKVDENNTENIERRIEIFA